MDSPPADQDVQTVIDLELRLLKHEIRAEPGEIDRLLHPDFSEFGASGRRWGRTEMIAALAAEQPVGEEPVVTATELSRRPAGGRRDPPDLPQPARRPARPPQLHLAPDPDRLAHLLPPGHADQRARSPLIRGQFVAEQVYQEAVVELAVGAALVLAHDPDRPEAHLGIAADGPFVVGRRVSRAPVVAAFGEQVPG